MEVVIQMARKERKFRYLLRLYRLPMNIVRLFPTLSIKSLIHVEKQ